MIGLDSNARTYAEEATKVEPGPSALCETDVQNERYQGEEARQERLAFAEPADRIDGDGVHPEQQRYSGGDNRFTK